MNRFLPRLSNLSCFCMLLLVLTSGCQIAPKDKPVKWPWKKDKSMPLPDRMLPVWTDTVLHQPNQPGVRGFGGRIYFYEKDKTDPIVIDGSLAVYVFDADDIDVNTQKPLRKFVFTAEQFNEHMSKTSIGPSYSIWLPWGDVGGPPRRLSLIARFEGREGGTTISDPTIKLLPGVPEKEQGDEATADSKLATKSPFRLSGHQKRNATKSNDDVDTEEVKSEPKIEVKTIELPPSFQRHLRGPSMDTTKPVDSNTSSSNETRTTTSTVEPDHDTSEHPLAKAEVPPIDAPITTQVYDYRTRRRNGSSALDPQKNDIRQGRWINSIARD